MILALAAGMLIFLAGLVAWGLSLPGEQGSSAGAVLLLTCCVAGAIYLGREAIRSGQLQNVRTPPILHGLPLFMRRDIPARRSQGRDILPREFRAPERPYRLALWATWSVGAAWMGIESHDIGQQLAASGVTVAAILAILHAARSRVVVTENELVDIGPLRTRRYPRSAITNMRVGHKAGYVNGYRLDIELFEGRQVALKALRTYSFLPRLSLRTYVESQAESIQEAMHLS